MNTPAQTIFTELLTTYQSIRREAQHAIIDAQVRREQTASLDELLQQHDRPDAGLVDLHELIRAEFGGKFGMLLPDSSLLGALRRLEEIKSEARKILKDALLEKHFAGQTYASGPLLGFTERHGGPLWYHLYVVSLRFLDKRKVRIEKDGSLSKGIDGKANAPEPIFGEYELINHYPRFLYGNIRLKDGRSFHFETIPDNTDFLFLEQPPFWKESVVVKRQ
jgi:hypothetical protein